MSSEKKNPKRAQVALIIIAAALFLILLLLPLRLSFKQGFQETLSPGFSGEVTVLSSEQLAFPKNATPIGAPIPAADGKRILFNFKVGASSNLSLWEEGIGFRPLSDPALEVVGAPVFSGDGTRAAFLAAKSKTSSERSLYLWEEGFGTKPVIESAFSGDWNLSFAKLGQSLLLTPQDATASFSGGELKTPFVPSSPLILEFTSRFENALLRSSVPSEKLRFHLQMLGTLREEQILTPEDAGSNAIQSLVDGEAGNTKRVRLKHSANALDVNNDGATDYLTFRPGAELPIWRALSSSDYLGFTKQVAGSVARLSTWRVGDNAGVPVPGDYNGDGVLDLATYTPGLHTEWSDVSGNWHIYLSKPLDTKSTRYGTEPYRYFAVSWGIGHMIAAPADYDGDGATDVALFDRNAGTWYILFSKGGFNAAKALLHHPDSGAVVKWGQKRDVLVPADYNGDGRSEVAVWREPKNGQNKLAEWHVRYLPNEDGSQKRSRKFEFGKRGDVPLPADYNGDGTSEPAVYSEKDGKWYVRFSKDNIEQISWTVPGAIPFTGDFDGDGAADFAFFNPGGGYRWQVLSSRFRKSAKGWTQDALPTVRNFTWGTAEELPVQVLLRNHQKSSAPK